MISVELVSSLLIPHVSRETFTKITWCLAPKFQGENFYKNRAIVDEIKKLATTKGCTLTQIALAWVAAQGMIAIPGTTKAKRLEENWASRDVELTEGEKEEMRKIIDSSKPHGNRYAAAAQATVGH
jgi:aryl-alcohol dehydrogenase-like predicted oxidoreductase